MVGLTREQRAQRMSQNEGALPGHVPGHSPGFQNAGALSSSTAADAATAVLDRPARPVRRPFGSQMQKLAYGVRPNFHRHWFNDVPGRVQQAIEAGYTHVTDKDGDHVARVVDSSGMKAFLMETPQEWYDEDMRAEQERVDEVDKAIRRGAIEGEAGKEGRYVPQRGIKVERR